MGKWSTGKTLSWSMPNELYDRVKKAFPRHGSRSKIICMLVRLYLEGKIVLSK